MQEAAETIHQCITHNSVPALVEVLSEQIQSGKNSNIRIAAATLIGSFCQNTTCDYRSHLPSIFKALLGLYICQDTYLQEFGVKTLGGIIKAIKNNEILSDSLGDQIEFVRKHISRLTTDKGKRVMEHIPAFENRDGLNSLFPMFQDGLKSDSDVIREHAAAGLGEVIEFTPISALTHSLVTKITGPLVRYVGDRFPSPVKVAILDTLGLLIRKNIVSLKAFLQPLQKTFTKSLKDESKEVRDHAKTALINLVVLSRSVEALKGKLRVDPLITDLTKSIVDDSAPGIQTSFLQALIGILSNSEVGAIVSETCISKVFAMVMKNLDNPNDGIRTTSSRLSGIMIQYVSSQESQMFFSELFQECLDWRGRDGRFIATTSVFKNCPPEKINQSTRSDAVDFCLQNLQDDNVVSQCGAVRLAGTLANFFRSVGSEDEVNISHKIIMNVCDLLASDINQIRLGVLRQLELFCTNHQTNLVKGELKEIVTLCLKNLSESVGVVRRSCQKILYVVLQYNRGFQTGNTLSQKLRPKLKPKLAELLIKYCKTMNPDDE
eukprot:TRINITY_DN209_c0_g1_i1.p1 TRINITY_DN209_c0_g1~~TRINITY_DN209_c0_g1_i1.p1  ORF type:complete len:549 (+),score=65.30 TRINITY_DN209_c0_g1_i1:119-1765(+)